MIAAFLLRHEKTRRRFVAAVYRKRSPKGQPWCVWWRMVIEMHKSAWRQMGCRVVRRVSAKKVRDEVMQERERVRR